VQSVIPLCSVNKNYNSGHTRELRYQALSREAFVVAMMSSNTGLTHVALQGVRKQSVVDAQRLLSRGVACFMQDNQFCVQPEYVRHITD